MTVIQTNLLLFAPGQEHYYVSIRLRRLSYQTNKELLDSNRKDQMHAKEAGYSN